MARSAFYEESAVSVNARSEARAANALHIVSILCLVLAGIIVFLSLTIVPNWIGMYLEGDVSLAWLIMQLVVWASPVEKKLYVLECRQQLLEFIVMAAGITKFERQ